MNDNAEIIEFNTRHEYRNWLITNHKAENGIWIVFTKGSKTFTANDAVEEAICFGWIDGLMKSIDEKTYKKYFSKRKATKNWSAKNITIYERLLKNGLITNAGIDVYKVDTQNEKPVVDLKVKIVLLKDALKENDEMLNLFNTKTLSRQKQFAGFYCEAKTDETRKKRKEKIIIALQNNYAGMLY